MPNEVLLHLTRQVFTMFCCGPPSRGATVEATVDFQLTVLPMGTNQRTNTESTANRTGAVGTFQHLAPSFWTLPRARKLVGLVLPAAVGSFQLIERVVGDRTSCGCRSHHCCPEMQRKPKCPASTRMTASPGRTVTAAVSSPASPARPRPIQRPSPTWRRDPTEPT